MSKCALQQVDTCPRRGRVEAKGAPRGRSTCTGGSGEIGLIMLMANIHGGGGRLWKITTPPPPGHPRPPTGHLLLTQMNSSGTKCRQKYLVSLKAPCRFKRRFFANHPLSCVGWEFFGLQITNSNGKVLHVFAGRFCLVFNECLLSKNFASVS